MTDYSEHCITICGPELSKLETMADMAGTTPEDFLIQSLVLGYDLAQHALNARPKEAHIYFEEEPGSLTGYAVNFSPAPLPELPDPAFFDFESQVLGDERTQAFPIESRLVHAVETVGALFDSDAESFLSHSTYFRHRWSLSQRHSGRILLTYGEIDEAVEAYDFMAVSGPDQVDDD